MACRPMNIFGSLSYKPGVGPLTEQGDLTNTSIEGL